VVDNASADGSAAMVRQEFPQAKLIANVIIAVLPPPTIKPCAKASGRYVLLLNPIWKSFLIPFLSHMMAED
jgi:hypothetical protein